MIGSQPGSALPSRLEGETGGGGSASLSMGHNSAGVGLPPEADGQQSLPLRLTGSQKKTAFALRHNAEQMFKLAGVESIVFVTFTLGERDQWGEWCKVFDAAEASRRINNLARRVLADLFERFILVTERHADGGIHFHALAVLRGRPDVRTGFDFAAVEDGDYSSASDALRRVWRVLRGEVVAGMGFGRCEALPIKSSGEAVACYVSKYIEKNICNRLDADKGKRLVRYHGFDGHLKPNDFAWSTPKACEWRRKTRAIAATVGIKEPEQMRAKIGPRWAWRTSQIMFDAGLEINLDWQEGQMTRDQLELARSFMERDAQSWGDARLSDERRKKQMAIWERRLTAEESERLRADLEDARMMQEASGFTFEEAA